jgi:predicted RNA polymerase sigma factor
LPCPALRVEQTDWTRIAALYDALAQMAPSPVISLNRAVAVSMAFGPAAGLEIVDGLLNEPGCATIICCPACAAICWSAWTGTPKPGPSSNGLPA